MKAADEGTLLPGMLEDGRDGTIGGTMIAHSFSDSMDTSADNTLSSNLGTMVINSDTEDEDDSTMKRKTPTLKS